MESLETRKESKKSMSYSDLIKTGIGLFEKEKQLTYLDNDNKNSNTDSSSHEPSNNQLTRIHQASVSERFYYSFV
jgi:hypothetical protein